MITAPCPSSAITMFPSIPLLAVVSAPFKRAQLGLFQGKMKQYGNSVPNSKHKTRRTWLPNVHNKRLFSDALQQHIRIKLTTRALKTIKKVRVALSSGWAELERVCSCGCVALCSTAASTTTC